MGVATFYQRRPGPLAIDGPILQLLVDTVAVALVKDPDILDDDRFAKADSWNSRARIHQATGMVMAQLRLTPDDAMALIRAHAYAHRQTLNGISDDIIARTLDFRTADPDPGNGQP
jgi:AmiR/NasT family two-component response regulator